MTKGTRKTRMKNPRVILTKEMKDQIRRTFRMKRGQARVKRLWQQAHEAWHWLEGFRLP